LIVIIQRDSLAIAKLVGQARSHGPLMVVLVREKKLNALSASMMDKSLSFPFVSLSQHCFSICIENIDFSLSSTQG
jgi:hypothetical protein